MTSKENSTPHFLDSDPGLSRGRDSILIYSKMILVGSKIHPGKQGSHECGRASSLHNQTVSITEAEGTRSKSHWFGLSLSLVNSLRFPSNLLGVQVKSIRTNWSLSVLPRIIIWCDPLFLNQLKGNLQNGQSLFILQIEDKNILKFLATEPIWLVPGLTFRWNSV